ncbi:MAG: hypothetical protein H6716_16115 [Polyangiaceae bacterium]|nr:hypothetical protein [Polyangiaceae bacterium]
MTGETQASVRVQGGHARGQRTLLAALCFGCVASVGESALADHAECGAAYVAAQKLMREGKLRSARKQLIECAKDCLPEVERDCTTWLTEVGSSMPTVVVVALDGRGEELSDVSVEIDGETRAASLDGHALEVDPGRRRLKVTRRGKTHQLELTILQGEKNRRVEVHFPEVNPAPPESGPSAGGSPNGATTQRDQARGVGPRADAGLPTGAWIAGGVSLTSLLGAAYFWLAAENLRQDLLDRGCAPGCPEADRESIRDRRVIGDVLLGVGVVSAGVFGYLWLSDSGPAAAPTRDGAWAGWRGRF